MCQLFSISLRYVPIIPRHTFLRAISPTVSRAPKTTQFSRLTLIHELTGLANVLIDFYEPLNSNQNPTSTCSRVTVMEHMACLRAPLASLYFSTSSLAFLSRRHGRITPRQFRSGDVPDPLTPKLRNYKRGRDGGSITIEFHNCAEEENVRTKRLHRRKTLASNKSAHEITQVKENTASVKHQAKART